MNKIEIFNTVKDHMLKQMLRSTKQHGVCAYRGDGGLMCAVGCLIDDDHYGDYLEGLTMVSEDGLVQEAVEGSIGRTLSTDEVHMLVTMQLLHDHHSIATWAEQLDALEASL